MKWFIGHRVLREQDGSTVILYLNQYLTEFSAEFFHDAKQSYDTSIEDSAYSYIKSNIPNVNIKKIKIMLGALALANISSPKIIRDNLKNNKVEALSNIIHYTVKEKDTLAKIANCHNTTVASLKSLNYIGGERIFAGQKLKIYGIARAKYLVKEQDNVKDIADSFNVTVNHLKYVNSVISIELGQHLLIPRQESELFINMLPDINLSKDSIGIHVKRLQLALYLCGYYVEMDGIFGKGTESIIYKLQSSNNIRATGSYNEHAKSIITNIILGHQTIIKNPDDALVLVNSKYRLPYNYIPNDLIVPEVEFASDSSINKRLLRKDVSLSLTKLFDFAKQNEIELIVTSAYQSYPNQEQMFINYANSHNLNLALKAIDKPGQSEHQTGLAVDIVSKDYNKDMEVSNYLNSSAYKFGFIVRYTSKALATKKHMVWHLRFVGKEAAKEITTKQLTLESYLHKES